MDTLAIALLLLFVMPALLYLSCRVVMISTGARPKWIDFPSPRGTEPGVEPIEKDKA
jgi:hypothetical protein